MIVLHAVIWPQPEETVVQGLTVHRQGPLGVLFEESSEPPAATREAVLAHGRRIAAIAEHRALLPMRYGTVAADLEALDALATEHADAWFRRLCAVEGHAEMLVHAAATAAPTGRAASGREHLRRRAEALHEYDRTWQALEDLARPWSDELRRLPDGDRMAVLVPTSDVDPFRESVAAWAAEHPAVHAAVTGPWPPFSFCEEPED